MVANVAPFIRVPTLQTLGLEGKCADQRRMCSTTPSFFCYNVNTFLEGNISALLLSFPMNLGHRILWQHLLTWSKFQNIFLLKIYCMYIVCFHIFRVFKAPWFNMIDCHCGAKHNMLTLISNYKILMVFCATFQTFAITLLHNWTSEIRMYPAVVWFDTWMRNMLKHLSTSELERRGYELLR